MKLSLPIYFLQDPIFTPIQTQTTNNRMMLLLSVSLGFI